MQQLYAILISSSGCFCDRLVYRKGGALCLGVCAGYSVHVIMLVSFWIQAAWLTRMAGSQLRHSSGFSPPSPDYRLALSQLSNYLINLLPVGIISPLLFCLAWRYQCLSNGYKSIHVVVAADDATFSCICRALCILIAAKR